MSGKKAEIKTVSNKVIVSGRLITERERKGGGKIVTIVSKNGKDVFLRFQVKSNDIIPPHKEHAHVKIVGHIESHTYRDTDKKFKQLQNFIADEITLSKTMTEEIFGVKGKFFDYPSCVAYIKGEIKKVTDEDQWVRIVLAVDPDDKQHNTSIRLSMRKLERQPELKKGDKICVVCSINTPRKEVNGKEMYFEDLNISDIAKIE